MVGSESKTISCLAPVPEAAAGILSEAAMGFVADLVRRFRGRVDEALDARAARQIRFDAGERPDFLAETQSVRDGSWTVAELPADLLDRRVEITGPVDRKMIINALNSGANVFMADFEDSSAPTFANMVLGQLNLRDAVRGTITFENARGKKYALGDDIATLMVRPRGWHLVEKHFTVDGRAVPASLFDFGLYFFHNAAALIEKGTGPYFYLPKLESHLEARLWNDVFLHAQRALGIAPGQIKATVLIETLPAAFEMDEILYELRQHSAGLNCGRWDYIFSYIKTFRRQAAHVVPDRGAVGMAQPFMRAYSQLLVKTCHRRGVHAMGGMAAQIPIKGDPEANQAALDKVRQDKLREVHAGHDGTWVAHPALVPLAKEIFDAHMPRQHQIDNRRDDVQVSAADLIEVPTGPRTLDSARHSARVAVQYIEAWLRGQGCVPLYNLMEDAATAEISRTQIWQWLEHGVVLDDGKVMNRALFDQLLDEEMAGLERELGDRFQSGKFEEAKVLFSNLTTAPQCAAFLTIPAYEYLLTKSEN